MREIKTCDICGKASAYAEIKNDVVYCSACAMAHDYAKASANRNPSLFN
jgi:hypothetical protein